MKPSEVIDKALTEVIPDESRWCQGRLMAEDKCCMAGAMMKAAQFNVNCVTYDLINPYYPARKACLAAIEELTLIPTSLPMFNDYHSYNEVRAVMEKARAGLQEQGL